MPLVDITDNTPRSPILGRVIITGALISGLILGIWLFKPSGGQPAGAGNGNKIAICHYPPGNENNPQSIEIDEHAWKAHQEKHVRDGGHDTEGECPQVTTTTAATTTTIPVTIETTRVDPTTTAVPIETTTTLAEVTVTVVEDTTTTVPEQVSVDPPAVVLEVADETTTTVAPVAPVAQLPATQ